jgi:hypothetical protein
MHRSHHACSRASPTQAAAQRTTSPRSAVPDPDLSGIEADMQLGQQEGKSYLSIADEIADS